MKRKLTTKLFETPTL